MHVREPLFERVLCEGHGVKDCMGTSPHMQGQ